MLRMYGAPWRNCEPQLTKKNCIFLLFFLFSFTRTLLEGALRKNERDCSADERTSENALKRFDPDQNKKMCFNEMNVSKPRPINKKSAKYTHSADAYLKYVWRRVQRALRETAVHTFAANATLKIAPPQNC